jgi:cytochrome b subunit of formate dehydrogenase
MIVIFLGHIVQVIYKAVKSKNPLEVFWGPNSMVPRLKDGQDIVAMFKWFFGRGEQPRFDRYTYWEKFDYWAVFWGMFIIGGSGLMLWFPTFFARLLPGWVFNIATILHGEEALLAVGFIFTIHFFNGHLRPEKFPMDMVIFTGSVTEHELREERPEEYERLVREGRLAELEVNPPSTNWIMWGRIGGGATVLIGLLTMLMIFLGFR